MRAREFSRPPVVTLRGDGESYVTWEVAALFGVDPRTVHGWSRRGWIGSVLTPGGHRRYPAPYVNELLHAQGLLDPAAELPGQSALPL